MEPIRNWVNYPAPRGSTYKLVYEPENVAIPADVGTMIQVLDGRPGVDVLNGKETDGGTTVTFNVRTLTERTLQQLLGVFVSDNEQFFELVEVYRTDSGAPSSGVATVLAWKDAFLDPIESVGRSVATTASQTAKTFTLGAFGIGLPVALLVGAFVLFRKGR